MRLPTLLSLLLLLAGCSSQHQIAGSQLGWQGETTQVISTFKTEELEIRHVRVEDTDCVSGFRDHLEVSGLFSAEIHNQLSKLLKTAQQCQSLGGVDYPLVVFMNGQGGSLTEGYQLGELLSSNNLHAVVTGNQRCGGACAVAFLGAKHKSVRHQGKLVLDAMQSPKTLAEGCFSQQQKTFLKRYLITVLSRSQGLALYDLALDRCGSSNAWEINRDQARIYQLTAL